MGRTVFFGLFLALMAACGTSRTGDSVASPTPIGLDSVTGDASAFAPVANAPPDSGVPFSDAGMPNGDGGMSGGGDPGMCGCSLCAPVISDDPCSRDSDCAPATPCHADRCVAKSKAQPRAANTSCTMLMACQSVDANKCGCFQGHCALTPKK